MFWLILIVLYELSILVQKFLKLEVNYFYS